MALDKQNTEVDEEPQMTEEVEDELGAMKTAQTMILDDNLVSKVCKSGYPKPYVVKVLNSGELNHCTTFYYLLSN